MNLRTTLLGVCSVYQNENGGGNAAACAPYCLLDGMWECNRCSSRVPFSTEKEILQNV